MEILRLASALEPLADVAKELNNEPVQAQKCELEAMAHL